MREIPVGTDGTVALVDDEDYAHLSRWKWKLQPNGYVARTAYCPVRKYAAVTVLMHREILQPPAELYVDHKNRDRLDNQRSNLRAVTNPVNTRNQGVSSRNTSGVLGVSWDRQREKWRATTKHDGKYRLIGRFDNLEEAVTAREAYMAALPGALAS